MLVNSELYIALKEAGASHESAEAAAVILAEHELQFLKMKMWRVEALRGVAIVAIGLGIRAGSPLRIALTLGLVICDQSSDERPEKPPEVSQESGR